MTQRQRGGNDSTNNQAGNDIVIHHHGLSYTEARTLILDLLRANMLELKAMATTTAAARVERFMDWFLHALRHSGIQANFDDPDLQYALFFAEEGYARSGDDTLGAQLVDLLVRRCGSETGSLQAIVLNEAIQAVRKLTPPQIDALTIAWLGVKVRIIESNSLDELCAEIAQMFAPFISKAARNVVHYEHLQYAGCVALTSMPSLVGYEENLRYYYPGFFAAGFARQEASDEIWDAIRDIVVPLSPESDRLRLNVADKRSLEVVINQLGISAHRDFLGRLLDRTIPANEVKSRVLDLQPGLEALFEIWTETKLYQTSLTTVGTAIAYSNWHRMTGEGNDVPLSVWIGDF